MEINGVSTVSIIIVISVPLMTWNTRRSQLFVCSPHLTHGSSTQLKNKSLKMRCPIMEASVLNIRDSYEDDDFSMTINDFLGKSIDLL